MEQLTILEVSNPQTPIQSLAEPYNFSFTFTSAFSSSASATVSTPEIIITAPDEQLYGSNPGAAVTRRKPSKRHPRGSKKPLLSGAKNKQTLKAVENDATASRSKPASRKANLQIEKARGLTDWPNVHSEMDLQELIVARGLLMTTLAGGAQTAKMTKVVSRFKAADTTCRDLWDAATTLRELIDEPANADLFNSSKELGKVPALIRRYTIPEMEKSVEILTCRMLQRNNNNRFGQKGLAGIKDLSNRLGTGEHKKLVTLSSLLLGGIRDGNLQFVRGVLEGLKVYSAVTGTKKKENPQAIKRKYLPTKEIYIQILEIREQTKKTGIIDQNAFLHSTNKRYRDTEDLSESSEDEDVIDKDKDQNASKRFRHNEYKSISDVEPEIEESSAMEKFRMDIEGVKISGD